MARTRAQLPTVGPWLAAGIALAGCSTPVEQAPQTVMAAAASRPDAASCLGGSGPVVRIEGEQGYNPLAQASWEPGTSFDARGASWSAYLMPPPEARTCYPVQIGADWVDCPPARVDLYDDATLSPDPGPPMCLSGGTIVGKQPASASWHDVKKSANAAVTVNAVGAIVEGMRIHNVEDAFLPLKSPDFVIRGNWVTYNRDDCIENDAYAGGTIEDNLFDGCYTFYSAVNKGIENPPVAPAGGPDAVVTFRANLIRMQNMPGPYKQPREEWGYANVFKMWDPMAPGLALHDNIFLLEHPIDAGWLNADSIEDRIVSCSNNTIVWLGEEEFYEDYPEECFRVITDLAVWEEARRDWLDRHPGVERLAGDQS